MPSANKPSAEELHKAFEIDLKVGILLDLVF